MIEKLFLLIMLIPFCWMLLLAATFFAHIRWREHFLTSGVKWLSITMTSLCTALLVIYQRYPGSIRLDFPAWIDIGLYSFRVRFIIDHLGITYALLSSTLIGIIFRFSRNYLHREEGYFRFVFLLSTLLFGLMIVSFSRSLDLLFAGWELVGTTSVLLISYFYTNSQPVRHSLKALVSYRLCDMGILAAAAWAHHYLHTTDYSMMPDLLSAGHHHEGPALILVGVFVIWASLGKSGQIPFSSWLPAAMEGPTPSSAIFYGALSVHLGPFLLLRFHDYFTHFPALLWIVGIVGALSAIYASAVGRTRSDAKTMLAYATISQVGLIWVEIALGFTNFALFHIVAHASLRTWQYLRSSSLIQDFFENPAVEAERTIERNLSFEKLLSSSTRKKIFIHSLHGFHLDYLTQKVIDGFLLPFKVYTAVESRWMNLNNTLVKALFRKR